MTELTNNEEEQLRELPGDKPIILDNARCVYCGARFSEVRATKEHVVGRRFVPKGTLNGWWNLIVRVCRECNGKKADLENDISAITMAPDISGRFAEDDPVLRAEADRKARNSISRRTRKRVQESIERFSVNGTYGPVSIRAQFVGPPQIDSARAWELARLQMMGFFYFVTYRESEKEGGWWRGGFYPVMDTMRADWGNPVLVAFSGAVVTWEPCFMAGGAGGYFKAVIRRHPSAECWSWALEWNRKYRLVGFFGELAPAQKIADALPQLNVKSLYESPKSFLRYRIEVPLREEDDKLFAWDGNRL